MSWTTTSPNERVYFDTSTNEADAEAVREGFLYLLTNVENPSHLPQNHNTISGYTSNTNIQKIPKIDKKLKLLVVVS